TRRTEDKKSRVYTRDFLSSEVPFVRSVFPADLFKPYQILLRQLVGLCDHIEACFKSILEGRIQHVNCKPLFAHVIDCYCLFLESRLHLLFETFILVFEHVEKMIDIYIQENGTMLHDDTILPCLCTAGYFTSLDNKLIPARCVKTYAASDIG